MIDVLIDMPALNTCTRERGIGRYVRSLCAALSRRTEWLDRYPHLPGRALSLAGLVRHRGHAHGAVDPTLSYGGDDSIETTDAHYQRHKLERRLFMGSLLHRVDCRLAHLPDPPGTPYDRRRRRIVTCHDLIPLVLHEEYLSPLPGARALQRARDEARYKSAARVIAISEATRRDLIEHLDVEPSRIDVVHHGVDHERFKPEPSRDERALLAEKLGIARSFLLYLGAGDARKNLPLLVRAFAQSGVGRDVSLVVAGPLSKRQRARLEHEAETHGVRRDLVLLGYVPEETIAPLYRQCLAHVFPSSYEGFGLTVLEAMACGAPTLTTALSALDEVAGEAALKLVALEEAPFAKELERLVSDVALRDDLRRRGLSHAAQFTWERSAARTLAAYARALEEA